MKFERIVVDRFGGLTDFDTGDDPLHSLVTVCGPNEAGKSSLFTFLTSILYGFYPASRDQHPYSPWSGGEIDGHALLRLADGRLWNVHRRLLAAPWGRLAENGRIEDIRNRSLDFTARVPREAFQKIYALTLGDLAGLEGESWAAVQDRLVGSMGAPDVVPPRDVIKGLEQEANELWRPDRRGKPVAAALAEELRGLRTRRGEAQEADRILREKVEALADVKEELREAREERERSRLLRERIAKLLPIRRQLLRIEERRERAGPVEELKELPPDPAGRLEALEAERDALRAEVERLEAAKREPQARIDAVTEEVGTLLEHGDAVAALGARSGEVLHARSRQRELEEALRECSRRCEEEARELLSTPGAEVRDGAAAATPIADTVADAVEDIPPGALRQAVRDFNDAAGEYRSYASDDADDVTDFGGGVRVAAGMILVALGLALALLGETESVPWAVGIVSFLIGAMVLAGWWSGRRVTAAAAERDRSERQRAAARREAAGARMHSAKHRIDELLAGLPLREAHRVAPGPELAEGLVRLQALLRERRSIAASLEENARAMNEVKTELKALRESLGLDLPAEEPAQAIALLDRALREAEDAARAADAAKREVTRVEASIAEMEEKIESCGRALETLREQLENLGAADLERGIREAEERLRAHEDAAHFEAELEREHADLEELRRRIAAAEEEGESWTVDDDTLAGASVREEELTDRVEELRATAEGMERDIEHMAKRATLDDIESAIEEVRDQIAAVARSRDRKLVLARLVREADRSFRSAHQPDIVRRAAEHMSTITGGRYPDLALEEVDEGAVFHLRTRGGARPLPVEEPLSTGTREQFYLALRLAIVDHLDAGGELLPLFMDEAFVNWDRERRTLGFDLLEELSSERQIFVFTCHDAMADELEARGAHTIRLGERV